MRPPVSPMLARLDRTLPRGGYFYEPKWDGFRALAFKDRESVELQSRNLNRLGRYFPELVEAMRLMRAESFVLDGEIVIAGEGGFDFGTLLRRIHPGSSRVAQMSVEMPATFVAFDVLAVGDENLLRAPFAERRRRLEVLLTQAPPAVKLTPTTTDPAVAERWLDDFNGGGVDGVVAKRADLLYEPGSRAMVKVKRERTADCVVAGIRVSMEGEVTSLLLGLYDDGGRLRHVGVSSGFSGAQRRRLRDELGPLASPLEGHPWEHGFGIETRPMGRLPGAAGSWRPGMSQDWVPVRPELVCEVAYDQLDGDRFRHPARFRRWRPDRAPASCGFAQLRAETGFKTPGARTA